MRPCGRESCYRHHHWLTQVFRLWCAPDGEEVDHDDSDDYVYNEKPDNGPPVMAREDSFPFLRASGSLLHPPLSSHGLTQEDEGEEEFDTLEAPLANAMEEETEEKPEKAAFLADGRATVREAMRLFLWQNHLFESEDELETFLDTHRVLIRRRPEEDDAPAASDDGSSFHELSSIQSSRLRFPEHGDTEQDEPESELEPGILMDYDRVVSTYALQDEVCVFLFLQR